MINSSVKIFRLKYGEPQFINIKVTKKNTKILRSNVELLVRDSKNFKKSIYIILKL